jgi:hypothetical protein
MNLRANQSSKIQSRRIARALSTTNFQPAASRQTDLLKTVQQTLFAGSRRRGHLNFLWCRRCPSRRSPSCRRSSLTHLRVGHVAAEENEGTEHKKDNDENPCPCRTFGELRNSATTLSHF